MNEYKDKNLDAVDGKIVLTAIVFLWILFLTINIDFNLIVLLAIITIILSPGFVLVHPNEGLVSTNMGCFSGVLKKEGFYWISPLNKIIKISLKINAETIRNIKINNECYDISIIWKVENISKTIFMLNNHNKYIEAIIYTNFEKIKNSKNINAELSKYFDEYGIKLIDFKVNTIIN